jgi:hypothetical protein
MSDNNIRSFMERRDGPVYLDCARRRPSTPAAARTSTGGPGETVKAVLEIAE